MKYIKPISILLFCLVVSNLLIAQSADEEATLLYEYRLPNQAMPESGLTKSDSLLLLDGIPYTGTAYLRYDNRQLKQATQFKDGKKHGYQYVWYPDGKPLLMSHYKSGYLNGRFKGWYQFGGIIYDMMMKDSRFGGDQRYEQDSATDSGSDTEFEPEINDRDQDNDE